MTAVGWLIGWLVERRSGRANLNLATAALDRPKEENTCRGQSRERAPLANQLPWHVCIAETKLPADKMVLGPTNPYG